MLSVENSLAIVCAVIEQEKFDGTAGGGRDPIFEHAALGVGIQFFQTIVRGGSRGGNFDNEIRCAYKAVCC